MKNSVVYIDAAEYEAQKRSKLFILTFYARKLISVFGPLRSMFARLAVNTQLSPMAGVAGAEQAAIALLTVSDRILPGDLHD